jgi:hypothetical protein
MALDVKISGRGNAGTTDTTRGTDYGGRGVRTASVRDCVLPPRDLHGGSCPQSFRQGGEYGLILV